MHFNRGVHSEKMQFLFADSRMQAYFTVFSKQQGFQGNFWNITFYNVNFSARNASVYTKYIIIFLIARCNLENRNLVGWYNFLFKYKSTMNEMPIKNYILFIICKNYLMSHSE